MKLQTKYYQLEYENAGVRWIKSNDTEIIRMIYSAVRDHNWGTIETEITSERIQQTDAGFQVDVQVKYKKDNIDFEAEFLISGVENRLVFEMKGEAKSSFKTNRVGFCVLHPIKECAGKECTVFHPGGETETAFFPGLISPQQPMVNISALEWQLSEKIKARLKFEGDIFEMEDQRNWTDASYKTYCRPLDLPFPYEIKKGEKVQQKIILEIQGEYQNEISTNNFSFSFDRTRTYKIPEIGFGATSRNEPLENSETELLKKLKLKHLRAEIKLFKPCWKSVFEKVNAESNLLKLPLLCVFYFSEKFKDEIKEIKQYFQNKKLNIKYILVVGKNHLPDNLIFDGVFDELKNIFPKVKIGAGVNAYFAELNRHCEISEKADFISFAICPQVHAFDNASLVENLEAQKFVVETAQQLFPKKPVFVSPITLKQRFNVVATSKEPEPSHGELPPQVDERQNSVFAAQWLLGSLKYLAQSGAGLATFFETVGWRGFIQGNFEPPVPEKFSAKSGDIFPIYNEFKKLSGFSNIIHSNSSHPLLFDGLAVKSENETKLLLFSFSDEDIIIQINQCIYTNESKLLINEKNIEIKKRSVLLKAFDLLEILW